MGPSHLKSAGTDGLRCLTFSSSNLDYARSETPQRPKLNAAAFLKFFAEGNTAEDILKSEKEIQEIAKEINKKNRSGRENPDFALHKARAKQALDFIRQIKG